MGPGLGEALPRVKEEAGQVSKAKTTQTHPSRDTSPDTGSLNCGFLMQLFDKYLSLLYCKAIRTASEVGLLKRHHENKTIWIMNVSIYFPFIRALLKAPAETGVSQSFVCLFGAAQRLKSTALLSLTSCWFYPSVHTLKLPACTSVRESWTGFIQANGCNLGGSSVQVCISLCRLLGSAGGEHPLTAIRL